MKYERSQEDRILAILESRGAQWTAAPELARISLQYCRAIAALRHGRGIQIENRVEVVKGVRHGFYRLSSKPASIHPTNSPTETPSMFGDLRGHRDDG
jgi:hypothetical protein